MREYGKWLIIGLLLGVGISLGNQGSDYYIDNYIIAKSRGPSSEVEFMPEEIVVSNVRVVKTPLSYNVVGQLENNSKISYIGYHVTAELHDKSGLLEVCDGLPVTNGQDQVNFTLLCNISNNEYPSVIIKNVIVTEGIYHKTT